MNKDLHRNLQVIESGVQQVRDRSATNRTSGVRPLTRQTRTKLVAY